MPNQELIKYIQEALKQGFSKEQIKEALLKEGWEESEVENGFRISEGRIIYGSPELKPSKSTKKVLKFVIPIFLILAIGIGGWYSIKVYQSYKIKKEKQTLQEEVTKEVEEEKTAEEKMSEKTEESAKIKEMEIVETEMKKVSAIITKELSEQLESFILQSNLNYSKKDLEEMLEVIEEILQKRQERGTDYSSKDKILKEAQEILYYGAPEFYEVPIISTTGEAEITRAGGKIILEKASVTVPRFGLKEPATFYIEKISPKDIVNQPPETLISTGENYIVCSTINIFPRSIIIAFPYDEKATFEELALTDIYIWNGEEYVPLPTDINTKDKTLEVYINKLRQDPNIRDPNIRSDRYCL